MIEHDENLPTHENEETFSLLAELHNSSECTQRELATKLNVSLGKVNYLLKELIKRGLISVRNFSANPQKLKKVRYMLTKKGFNARVELTRYFLKKKENEYNRMKDEWERLNSLKEEEKHLKE